MGMVMVIMVIIINIIISLNLNNLTRRKSISGVAHLTMGVEVTMATAMVVVMVTAMAVDMVITGVGVRALANVPTPVYRRLSTRAGSTTTITVRW